MFITLEGSIAVLAGLFCVAVHLTGSGGNKTAQGPWLSDCLNSYSHGPCLIALL